MPMHLSVESMPDDARMQAVLYGPLVLAVRPYWAASMSGVRPSLSRASRSAPLARSASISLALPFLAASRISIGASAASTVKTPAKRTAQNRILTAYRSVGFQPATTAFEPAYALDQR